MTNSVQVFDTNTLGQPTPVLVLDFLTEQITVRELIRSRVYQEVKDYNVHQTRYFQGLVQPLDAEVTLNGYQMRPSKMIDWEQQFEYAIAAFQRNGFIVLVDDQQVTELDEEIILQPGSTVTFFKLVPLVGG